MKPGYLSEYFVGVMAKRLSAVEAHPEISNQHEFNGVNELKVLLGNERLQDVPTVFLRMSDDDEVYSEDSSVTWYDARERHVSRSEFRLYFKSNSVMNQASEGDLLVVAKRQSGDLMIFVIRGESSAENRLLWLFGLSSLDLGERFSVQHVENGSDRQIEFTARFILDEVGIETGEAEPDTLDSLIEDFGDAFPSTAEFSRNARATLPNVDAASDPDGALLAWIEHEERLFRHLERKIVATRLEKGFHDGEEADVDAFIAFSLSVQNRRKSRAGYAVENHLDEIFRRFELRYDRQANTENKSRPDFLFPGSEEYRNEAFPECRLSMLGVKSSCKERWRQVLAEARRIPRKHLLTLEPGISENQTGEMASNDLQLVLPARLHDTYSASQQTWLMSVNEFIYFIKDQQKV